MTEQQKQYIESLNTDWQSEVHSRNLISYSEQREYLINDLKGKLQREDWHGVSDAANDIRVLEAKYGN
jgi:hypothetical protein